MINRTVITSICFFMVVILCPTVNSISDDDVNKIKSGLEAGQAIAGLLENKKFGKSLSKIATGVGPYLGAIGPCIGLISAFNPSESAELGYMKKMMKAIDSRLDLLDYRFDKIERMIEWNSIKTNFGQIEQKIMAISQNLKKIFDAPPSAVENGKKLFISNYNSDYQMSGIKLYNFITKEHGVLVDNIGPAILRYTQKDRKKTQTFLLGVMQLLLQAVKVELTYLYVKKFDTIANTMKSTWTDRIQKVLKKFKNIDDQCVNAYYSQSVKEIDEYSAKNKGMTNTQFAYSLFDQLKAKYYWRNWIVVAYDPIKGWKNHCISVGLGYHSFRKYGRNILVASVDMRHPVMNSNRAKQEMEKVSLTYRSGNWFSGYRTYRRKANDIYHSLDKRGATLVGVIRCNAQLSMKYTSKRFVYVPRCDNHFRLLMWG